MSQWTMRIESDSCCYFASGHWHRLDARNVTINKLRAKQCRRYMQPSTKDEFEFSDSPPTSINKRIRSRANQLWTIMNGVIRVIPVIELSARDHTLSLRIRFYERLSTVFISINLFNLFQIYLTACNSNLSFPFYQSSTLIYNIFIRIKIYFTFSYFQSSGRKFRRYNRSFRSFINSSGHCLW